MKPDAEVSIVIVNWNSRDYVRQCIASIVAHTQRIRYEIIVVDSASFDGCDAMLHDLFPDVRYVQCQDNVGFGRASNIGVQQSSAEAVLLLNPDTELHGDAVSALHDKLRTLPRAGVIGCRLLNTDGSLQATCVKPFPTLLNQVLESRLLERCLKRHRLWKTAAAFEGARHDVPVEVIAGACMMLKRSVFDALGGFSDAYFMYSEDVELCFRSRQAGLLNYYVPGVEVVHHGGGSTKTEHKRFSTVLMRESRHRFMTRNRGAGYGTAYRASITAAAAARVALIALCAPVAVVRDGAAAWRASLGKWVTIFRWGIGLEHWAHRYYRPRSADTDVAP